MVLMTQAIGVSKIKENIFENRFSMCLSLEEWEQNKCKKQGSIYTWADKIDWC